MYSYRLKQVTREGRKERKIIMEKEEFIKNMEEQDVIFEKIAHLNPRSAWNRGVLRYALELVNSVEVGEEITEKKMLNGAENWHQYSEGGCALIYDELICRRLCTPSEIKKTRNGERRPNKQENWIDVQARALYQAARLIMKIKREVEK